MKKVLACALALGMSGCPDVKTDTVDDESGPTIEFDPSRRIVPFPNNLLLDRMTGKVNLPAQCNETATAKALRTGVINQLDGFGTFETAMSVTFTEAVDPKSIPAIDNPTVDTVLMFKRVAGGTAVDPASAMAVPVLAIPGTSVRYGEVTANADGSLTCASPTMVPSVTFVPRVPLDPKSTYVVALTSGVKTTTGASFNASFTWSLISQKDNPVTLDAMGNVISDRTPLDPGNPEDLDGDGVGDDLEQLQGINLLWNAHKDAIAFIEAKGKTRADILLAWEFNTQTTTDPLDPAVAMSPAAKTATMPFGGMIQLTAEASNRTNYPYLVCTTGTTNFPLEPSNTQCFLKMALGGGRTCTVQAACEAAYDAGNAACASVGCGTVGDVYVGILGFAAQYQTERPNAFDASRPIPGAWGDPLNPTMVKNETIQTIVVIPAGAAPATGWPTVVFQHGLGQSKTNILGIGPQLARDPDGAGPLTSFASVSIDAVAHDSRAVRISNDAARGCADSGTPPVAPSPVSFPQCYAGFLSPDLGATRDNIRQTVLDQQRLVAALKACGTMNCAPLSVDATHIVYMGQSLGGIMGSISASVTADIKAAVLNVAGVGWADILERTETRQIQCFLVDGLIDAGILTGDKFNPGANPTDPSDDTGLCTTPAWKDQPGYKQFSAIGRWVLDPADPANFTRKLAPRKFLLQEVMGDTVVPNFATDNEGALLGQMPLMADCAAANPPAPSMAITTMPTASKWLRYPTLPAGGACVPGNTFTHGSLLRPANLMADGRLGTARMQVDAITWLHINK